MRGRWLVAAMVVTTVCEPAAAQSAPHMNPVVDLLAAGKPVFGLYAPSNRRGGRGAPPPADSIRTPAQLALLALANTSADFVFDGSMEGNYDGAIPPRRRTASAGSSTSASTASCSWGWKARTR